MACKLYSDMAEELKTYQGEVSAEDMEKAYKKAREAEFADMADAYMLSKSSLVDTLNSAVPYYNKQKIEILDYYDRKGSKYIKYKYSTSDKQYDLFVGEYSPLTFGREGVTFEATVRNLDTLMSDANFVFEGEYNYEDRVTDSVNNPESIANLGQELFDNYGVDDVHQRMLLAKIKMMASSMKDKIGDVVVKINEEADKTGGTARFNADKAAIYINIGPNQIGMSPLEVYVHELNHVVLKAAIDSKDPIYNRDIRVLERLRAKVIRDFSADRVMEFMAVPDREIADAMLDYISDKKVGLHEFAAYADTNSVMRNMLSHMSLDREKVEHTNWASKLSEIIARIFDRIMGTINKTIGMNGVELAEGAIIGLVNANRKAQNTKRNVLLGKIIGPFLKLESNLVNLMNKKEAEFEAKDTVFNAIDGTLKWDNLKNVGLDSMKALVNKNYADTVAFNFSLLGLKPEGTIRTIIRDMSKSDVVMDLAEKLGLMSQAIDRKREMIATTLGKVIREGFSRDLESYEKKALTEVLMDTDISALGEKADLVRLLEDETYLQDEIDKKKITLKELSADDEAFNYYKNQADGLGFYMVKGTSGSLAQLLNAENIARRLETGKDKDSADKKLVKIIDELATLHALEYTKAESRATVARLIDREANGVKLIIGYQAAHKDNVEQDLFKSKADKMKLIKGYSKEVYPTDVDFQIGLREDEAEMKKKGYKKVRDLNPHALDSSKPMALYVSSLNVRQNLHRVALRYTDRGRKGTSILDKYSLDTADSLRGKRAKRDIANMKLEMTKQAKAMEQGDYKASSVTAGLLPVFNNIGKVTDFRYVLSKESKIKDLHMDNEIDTVIGRTYSSRYDKEQSVRLNDEIMELIEEDVKANLKAESKDLYAGVDKGLLEFVDINKNSSNAEIRDIWSVLPDNIQKKYPNGFRMRRELMHMLLGYREISIANAPGVTALPEAVKQAVRVAEKIWMDIVSIAKKNIVLKLPQVLIGNVVSNIGISVMTGFNPLTVAKLQLQGVKELNRWVAANREITELQTKIAAGVGTKEMSRRLSLLENEVRNNPATALVDEGFYTSILEEIEAGEREDKNLVTKTASKLLSKAPQIVRDGAELVYLADNTKIMKFMSSATQYSDFVARYAQYHLLISRGVEPQVAAKEVRDAYINYNKPNSRALEWANQMGLVMFTKYFTRIQKAIRNHVRTHPMKVIGAILAQEFVLGDIDDFTDQSMLTKDITNLAYNPMDTLIRAITPQWGNALDAFR